MGFLALMNVLTYYENKKDTSMIDLVIQVEGVSCIRTFLNNGQALKYLLEGDNSNVNQLIMFLQYKNAKMKTQIVEVLAALCWLNSDGYGRVFTAFEYYANTTIENDVRFQPLIEALAGDDVIYKSKVLFLINALINAPTELDTRINMRIELLGLGLWEQIEKCRQVKKKKLRVQISAFETHMNSDYEKCMVNEKKLDESIANPQKYFEYARLKCLHSSFYSSFVKIQKYISTIPNEITDPEGAVLKLMENITMAVSKHTISSTEEIEPNLKETLLDPLRLELTKLREVITHQQTKIDHLETKIKDSASEFSVIAAPVQQHQEKKEEISMKTEVVNTEESNIATPPSKPPLKPPSKAPIKNLPNTEHTEPASTEHTEQHGVETTEPVSEPPTGPPLKGPPMKGPPLKGPPMKGPPIKGGKVPNLPALPGQPDS